MKEEFDRTQPQAINPTRSVAETDAPRKLTDEEYLQDMISKATSPQAAEINPTFIAAEADAPRKLTDEEYLQDMISKATSSQAAEINPTFRAADPDDVIYRKM